MRVFKTLLALLLVSLCSHNVVAQETILALPFENTSQNAEYNWIGEGFTLTLLNLLSESGMTVIDRDERNLAYEKVGLQPSVLVTRATALKIADKAGADLLVTGTYRIEGTVGAQLISVTARIINVREMMTIGSDLNFAGSISKLQWIQGQLAWEILHNVNPNHPISRDQMVNRSTSVPLSAFESYTKALLTSNREDKVRFLFKAISEYQKESVGQYTQAIFKLGQLYYSEKNYRDAFNWFDKIPQNEPQYLEARFYAGVCMLHLSEPAAENMKRLSQLLPLYEVYNNAAIAELRHGDINEAVRLLGLAVQGQPNDSDILFNYGYALWKAAQYPAAANQLNKLVRSHPKDGQAFYLLAKSLEKMEQKPEAAAALDEAKKYLPEFAKWETGKMPQLGRLKEFFSRSAYERLKKTTAQREVSRIVAESQSAQSNGQLRRAHDLFQAGRDSEALTALAELLREAPDNGHAHLLMARIKERRGQTESAVNSLKAAIFWNPKLTAAHVLLGKIYLQQNNRAQAEVCARNALEADPADAEAQAFSRMLQKQ